MPSPKRSPDALTSGKRLGSLSLAVTLLLAACGQSSLTQTPNSPAAPIAGTPPSTGNGNVGGGKPDTGSFTLDPTHTYVAGQVVVGVSERLSAASAAQLVGGRVISELPALRAAVIALPAGLSVEKAIRRYAGAGKVRYAEPNYLAKTPERAAGMSGGINTTSLSGQAVADPKLDDPQLGKQWFLKNMGVYKAWETATGKGIRIGIADEDIDRTHPDLKANMAFPGFDAPNNAVITATTPYDGIGEHGTWVAGTAAAVGNNGIGGAGVAYQASIVPLTITHDPVGASNVDSARAFVWGVTGPDGKASDEVGDSDTPAGHKGFVDIVNYSFGGTGYSQLSKEAIDYILSKGVLFVTSAGNTPTTGPASPAWSPGAVSVAATVPTNQRTGFSNRGDHLSVAAPGENMWVTAVRPDVSVEGDVNYSYVNGTSFASPATAGAAALILQASAQKNADGSIKQITLTPAQIRHILEDTALKPDGGYSLDTGNGIVRADAAVALASKPDAASTVQKGVSVSLKFVAASDPTIGIPLVGATLSGGKRPSQLLYGQSAAGGGYFPAGTVEFNEIDAGAYQLYASGPRTVVAGGTPATLGAPFDLAAGQSLKATVPLPVTIPKDANEPNNTQATATAIDYGQVLIGTLPLDDGDFYTFSGVAGEQAFINTQTISGSPDLRIQVLDAGGKVLATNTAQREGVTDAALTFDVPADGKYTVQVDDEGTGSPFNIYWLGLSRVAGAETEPNGSASVAGDVFSKLDFSGANALEIGQALDANLAAGGEVDIYTFSGKAGQNLVADINAAVSVKPDSIMALYQAGNATPLASNDDSNTTDSTILATLPADGKYYLVVSSYQSSTQSSAGDYRVSLGEQ
ncbi:S8 family serine peptidase [Deinococcus sp.]|uniref:S8 family serine peptidase n=1 Tax=Deinococcus sp. TaxID=47478 RepID=UPI003B594327